MKPDVLEEEDIEIIDAHAHLGNIAEENGGAIIHQTGLRPNIIARFIGWLTGKFKYQFGELKEPGKIAREIATYSGRQRIAAATLENMQAEITRAGISQVCCLPIPPYVTFEDLNGARDEDKRIIPFTGFDFEKMGGYEDKITKDVIWGAKGMKIHPIIQKISPTDERVLQVAEEFGGKHGLPILFHTGRTTYYHGKEKERENSDFGRLEEIEKMLESLRSDITIIIGHAGMFQFGYVVEKFVRFPNVHVDTTFQHPERIKHLLNAFGSHRVIYGSDWPYGDMVPHIQCAKEALANESDRRVHARVFRDNIKGLMGME